MGTPALHEVCDSTISDWNEVMNLVAAWNVVLPEDILALIQDGPFVRRQFCRTGKISWEVLFVDLEKIEESTKSEPCTVRGAPFMALRYRRKGLAAYISKAVVSLATEASFCDYGPDGISKNYTNRPLREPTEAERAEGRRHIQETVTQALTRQGIW